jgi:hypothetical protein
MSSAWSATIDFRRRFSSPSSRRASNNAYARVGIEPEARLRWLLDFGNLAPDMLTAEQRTVAVQEARTFVFLQEIDPALRGLMRSWLPLVDETPGVLTNTEVWSAQLWLKRGLGLLRGGKKWNFTPHVNYEIDVHKARLWVRLTAKSHHEKFKAMAYDVFREARFRFRVCPECRRPFVPVRRQAYCSAHCSQAVRTRKWRKAHPEKNREKRRQQYKRSVAATLRLSKGAKIKIAKPTRGSPK